MSLVIKTDMLLKLNSVIYDLRNLPRPAQLLNLFNLNQLSDSGTSER
jgi:hypothetical protein